MAYTNLRLRLYFDGSDEKLPNLGPDVWLLLRNPMLMPPSMLLPTRDVAVGPDGMPVNSDDAMRAGAEVMARLVLDWNMFDPMDEAEYPEALPLPATAEAMLKLPSAVTQAIGELIQQARNPR